MKKFMRGRIKINNSPAFKMSKLIAEYATDYINLGKTTIERQSFLNGACTAWNIANLPDTLREIALQKIAYDYKEINPGIGDVERHLHNMRKLIKKKLQMFPDIKKTIVSAFIEPLNGNQYIIKVISTDNSEALGWPSGKASQL